jgi:hypothetical protein
MPRVLAGPDATYDAKGYGPSILDFAVVWGFVSRLMASRQIAACFHASWPALATDMKMTYLAILTKGPFARLPAMAFAEGEGLWDNSLGRGLAG